MSCVSDVLVAGSMPGGRRRLLDSPALEVTVATSEKSSAQSWLLLKEPPAAFSWAIAAALPAGQDRTGQRLNSQATPRLTFTWAGDVLPTAALRILMQGWCQL